ncbi:MFS transporter [Mycobacterium sp. Y57]|nr:MFS transporter [Mycolicibacterium xanthum]
MIRNGLSRSTGWPRLPESVAFATAATTLVMVFLASGTAIPLYNTFRVENGATNSGLALTTVTYLGVTAVSLLTLGRLSNHLGRRAMAAAAVLSAVAGCLVLMRIDGLTALLIARALQGLACGIASSAVGAYVIDTAPSRPRWLAPMVASNAPPFAIPLGALISGALVQYAPAPRVLVFAIVAAVLVVCAVLLALCPETAARRPGAPASLRPRICVPRGGGRLLVAIGAVFVATWSLGGFFQAFAPTLTADHLGTDNNLTAAVVFASVMVLSPLGGSVTGRLRPTGAVRWGLALFVLATAAILAALHAELIGPFLVASLAAGLAMGAANTGATRAMLDDAAPADRAGLLATIFLVSYGGAAIPGLIAGRLAVSLPLDVIALCYGVLILVSAVVAVAVIRTPGIRLLPQQPVALESNTA